MNEFFFPVNLNLEAESQIWSNLYIWNKNLKQLFRSRKIQLHEFMIINATFSKKKKKKKKIQ